MKAICRATLVAFVLLLPFSAYAEIKAGAVEVSPFVGYNFFENGQNLRDRPVYGARLGYNITPHFGIEGAMEFINSRVDDRTKTADRKGEFGSPKNDVDLTFYHIDALYHFMPEGNFNPFVLAGFGGAQYSPNISSRDMSAFNVGLGAKYWVSDNVALRVDLRDYMVSEVFNHNYHNVAATMGIVFAFGGTSTASQPAAKTEPAPAPIVKEMVVIEQTEEKIAEPKIVVLALEDVHFDFDQSTLTPAARTILKRNIQLLKENPDAQIRIAGYTSASGTNAYNQKLSERRAAAVREYVLKESGIRQDRLSTIGYGETIPAIHESAPEVIHSKAAEANMRVLFEIIVK